MTSFLFKNVDIGFWGVTISHLMQSIIIILYWVLIKYIIYITFGFKTIQLKWIFEFVFRTPWIQMLIRRLSESMVNHTCINSAQWIFLWNIARRQAISPVAKFHHMFGHGFMIQGPGWYWFLSNVSQPIRIHYFTWKYNTIPRLC